MASNMQIGHLLRRAGFGATPDELTIYRNLGFNGAVDRLINYQQVPDDDMENRLKALNINLNSPLNQQRWWLLRMSWTQRPLMELFTLGLGHYTQRDVYEGAAALTGWHVKGLTSQYYPQDHNDLVKTYLGHTGNLDYKDVINILANHPATPWFVARKLFTFFAYENPSNDDLKPLVDTYVQSGHNMGEVMRTLLLSSQF